MECNTTIYILLVDHYKAYDTLSREALWQVLIKYGFPPFLVNIIKSLHDSVRSELIMPCTFPLVDAVYICVCCFLECPFDFMCKLVFMELKILKFSTL